MSIHIVRRHVCKHLLPISVSLCHFYWSQIAATRWCHVPLHFNVLIGSDFRIVMSLTHIDMIPFTGAFQTSGFLPLLHNCIAELKLVCNQQIASIKNRKLSYVFRLLFYPSSGSTRKKHTTFLSSFVTRRLGARIYKGIRPLKYLCTLNIKWNANLMHHRHHKHQGLDPLFRSVSRVTAARANASSVFQLFSFLVVCSGMISKGLGIVVLFASVKAISVYIHLTCLVCL